MSKKESTGTPYIFPVFFFVVRSGIKLDALLIAVLKYWLLSSKRVMQIIEDNIKPGDKKIIPAGDLRLEDVLIGSKSVEEVKSYYNFRRHKYSYLSKFLRILQSMGYFKRRLSSPEFQAIGRNDFDDPSISHRHILPPMNNFINTLNSGIFIPFFNLLGLHLIHPGGQCPRLIQSIYSTS